MKLTPISKSFFGVPEDDESFNLDAARESFHRVMASEHPDMMVRALANELLGYDIQHSARYIQPVIDEHYSKKLAGVKKNLVRSYISKAASGEDPEHIEALGDAIVRIQKAFELSEQQRREFARRQWRDRSGRFRTMNRKIEYTGGGAVSPAVANKMQIPAPPSGALADEGKRAAYQQSMLQIVEALKPFDAPEFGDALATINFTDSNGEKGSKTFFATNVDDEKANFVAEVIDGDGSIDSVEASVPNSLTAGGAAYDLLSGITGTGTAAGLVGNSNRYGQSIDTLSGKLSSQSEGDSGASRSMQRIGYGADALNTALGDQVGPKAKLALLAGRWLGQYGPAAEQVAGPATRKAAYRYRGVEKDPDPAYQRAVSGSIQYFQNTWEPPNGMKVGPEIRADIAHEFITQGSFGPTSRTNSPFGPNALTIPTASGQRKPSESPIVARMVDGLPEASRNSLNLASGHTPPSQGIIIDRAGNVVTQSIGYGDDHYLPFNLGTLKKVNGGEYFRTRMYGGPTAEDINAALITEARGFTVVSHSGVFHVEFDPEFRGARRFNDKAKRMVDRYEHLLDAVKSQTVSAGVVPPEVYAEKSKEAAKQFPGTTPEDRSYRERTLRRLVSEWQNNPEMPDGYRQELMREWADQVARQEGKTLGELHYNYVARKTKTAWEQYGKEGTYPEEVTLKFTAEDKEFANQAGIAIDEVKTLTKGEISDFYSKKFNADIPAALGMEEDWNSWIGEKEKAYVDQYQVLKLDGPGYAQALSALKEQFPYYIKDVSYRELKIGPSAKGRAGSALARQVDTGYVLPRYNRPQKAQAGYFDQAVTGSGKTTAQNTNYQNWAVRSRRGNYDDANQVTGRVQQLPGAEGQEGGRTGSTPPDTTPRRPSQPGQRSLVDVVRAYRTDQAMAQLHAAIIRPGVHWHPGFRNTALDFNQPTHIVAHRNARPDEFKILRGDIDDFLGISNSQDPNVPINRAALHANQGRPPATYTDRALRQDELNELLHRVPGFKDVYLEDARRFQETMTRGNGSTERSLPARLIDDAQSGAVSPSPGSQSDYDWQSALRDPQRIFNFTGREYSSGQPGEAYRNEFTHQHQLASGAASAIGGNVQRGVEGIRFLDSGNQNVDAISQAVTRVLFNEINNLGGRQVMERGSAGMSEEKQEAWKKLLEHLARMRALQRLAQEPTQMPTPPPSPATP